MSTNTIPVKKAAKPACCQHESHPVAVIMPAEYREVAGAKRFLCEAHALPAIAEFGVSR